MFITQKGFLRTEYKSRCFCFFVLAYGSAKFKRILNTNWSNTIGRYVTNSICSVQLPAVTIISRYYLKYFCNFFFLSNLRSHEQRDVNFIVKLKTTACTNRIYEGTFAAHPRVQSSGLSSRLAITPLHDAPINNFMIRLHYVFLLKIMDYRQ